VNVFSSLFFIGQILPECEFKNQKWSVYGGVSILTIWNLPDFFFWLGFSINSQKYIEGNLQISFIRQVPLVFSVKPRVYVKFLWPKQHPSFRWNQHKNWMV
jgi:hypothetical protein